MPVVSCTVAAMGMGSISFRSQFKTFEITAKSCLTIVLLVGTAAVPRGGCIRNMLRGRLLCAFGIGIALSLRASSTLFLQTGVMLFLLHKADQPLAFVLSQGRLLFLTEVKWQGGFPSCEVAVHWSLLALVEAPCWKVLRRHGFHGHKWQIEAGYFLGAVTAADHKLTMYNTPPRLALCWLTSFDTHNQLIFPTLAVCHPRMSLYKVSAKRPNSIFGVEDQRSARVREDGHKPAAGRARTKMRMRTLTLMLSPKAAMVCFPASCSFAHVSVRTRKAFHGCNQTTRHTLHAPTLDAAQPPQLLRQVVALGKATGADQAWAQIGHFLLPTFTGSNIQDNVFLPNTASIHRFVSIQSHFLGSLDVSVQKWHQWRTRPWLGKLEGHPARRLMKGNEVTSAPALRNSVFFCGELFHVHLVATRKENLSHHLVCASMFLMQESHHVFQNHYGWFPVGDVLQSFEEE